MPFAKGTLVYVNYTAKVKDTGDPIETTLEDEAKKLDIYDADRRYEPRLVAVGEDWVLKGLDEEIAKMDVGEKKTAELPPDRAWGGRDPTLMRMVPLRKFGEKADELRVGDEVEMDNRIAVVRFIGSGRAQVDFNHRLAGKTLIYEIEALRKVEPGEDTIRSLMKRRFPGEGEKLEFTQNGGEVSVTDTRRGVPRRGTTVHQEGHRERHTALRPRGDEGHLHRGLPTEGRGREGQGQG